MFLCHHIRVINHIHSMLQDHFLTLASVRLQLLLIMLCVVRFYSSCCTCFHSLFSSHKTLNPLNSSVCKSTFYSITRSLIEVHHASLFFIYTIFLRHDESFFFLSGKFFFLMCLSLSIFRSCSPVR